MKLASGPPPGSLVVFSIALLARGCVAWASLGRAAPAMDGTFYDIVARRIALGQGYTWQWPDGVVTYAAHYPVGYPALLGGAYALFGPHLIVAFFLNAVVGALSALCAYQLADSLATNLSSKRRRRVSWIAGLLVAFLPTLAGYTPALMTEGLVTFLILASALGVAQGPEVKALDLRFGFRAVAIGCGLGLATLVRPQSLLFGPVLGWIMGRRLSLGRRLGVVALVSIPMVAFVSPWTFRNCARMDRCVFVSANGGWNLLIGTFPEGEGGWAAVEGARVPPECREVYAEVEKDRCFGAAGRAKIREAPLAWLGLAPKKLRVTFDYTGAAAEYLSRAGALSESGRLELGAIEIISQRLLFLLALVAVVRAGRARFGSFSATDSGRPVWTGVGTLLAGAGYLGLGAAYGHLGLWLATRATVGPRAPRPLVLLFASLGLTALVHVVFFGAGRYTLPFLPLFAPLAALAFDKDPAQVLTSREPAPDN
jgi:4-amino-4-deoxy-L-arabinose transferase-like glycosyltransferase